MRWDIGAALLFVAGCVAATVWLSPTQEHKTEAPDVPVPPPGFVLDSPPGFVLEHPATQAPGEAIRLADPNAVDQLNVQAARDWERQQQREAAYQQQRAMRELAEEVRSLKQD